VLTHVAIHESQFPDQVHRSLVAALRSRQLRNKFHYESYKQARKWIALHEAFSPARRRPHVIQLYDDCFRGALDALRNDGCDLIGLCVGNGWKEARLASILRAAGKQFSYGPSDSSVPLVLLAQQAVRDIAQECHPLVCDFETAPDWLSLFSEMPRSAEQRLFTLFGAFHNFEPPMVLGQLKRLLAPADALLVSLNLAQGDDYAESVRASLPEYDNELTRDWLAAFLNDLGIESDAGEMEVLVEECPFHTELLRIAVYFRLKQRRLLQLSGEEIEWAAGDSVRLFFSYRYTPERFRACLSPCGIHVAQQWVSGTEGLFLCRAA